MEKDFVCGTEIDKTTSAGSYSYKGTTYHFCSESCRDQFSKDPNKFLKG
jgi:P-type Cu+ transporter